MLKILFICFNEEYLNYQETNIQWDDKKGDYEIIRKNISIKKHVKTANMQNEYL